MTYPDLDLDNFKEVIKQLKELDSMTNCEIPSLQRAIRDLDTLAESVDRQSCLNCKYFKNEPDESPCNCCVHNFNINIIKNYWEEQQ